MTTLLIDGPNMAMRALHAGQHAAMTANGVNTAPLTIFAGSLGKLVRDVQPTHLGIAWDAPGPNFRHALYADYKGQRNRTGVVHDTKDATYGLLEELISFLGIYHVRWPKMEADDVIASWWQHATEGPLVIASSDHDFLQLVGPNPQGIPCKQVRFSSANTPTDEWDEERLMAVHGYTPTQYPLIAALSGDTSDNIPGLPGIGPKKALKLMQVHDWSLEKALEGRPAEQVESVHSFFNMINLRDQHVVVPSPPRVDFAQQGHATWPILERFLDLYELKTLKGKLKTGLLWKPETLTGIPGRGLLRES